MTGAHATRAASLRRLLAHPLTRGRDLDDPETTVLRRRIVRENRFLRRVYEDWYRALAADVPHGEGAVLELGSGAGFLEEFIPGLITSEVLPTPGVRRVVDARALPFEAGALKAIVMTDVLHHIPGVREFFAGATRCVRPGGVIAMIEPWVTAWSRFVYTRLHHEPFRPDATEWDFPASGPLSGANGALPWILVRRDRASFEREFPLWRLETVEPIMPVRYLLSGGVSMRPLMPGFLYGAVSGAERLLGPISRRAAMFAHIRMRRVEASEP